MHRARIHARVDERVEPLLGRPAASNASAATLSTRPVSGWKPEVSTSTTAQEWSRSSTGSMGAVGTAVPRCRMSSDRSAWLGNVRPVIGWSLGRADPLADPWSVTSDLRGE